MIKTYVFCLFTLFFALTPPIASANAKDLLIDLVPAYKSDGSVSYINFQIKSTGIHQGQYVAGFDIKNGHGECNFGSSTRSTYMYRKKEPGSVVARLFKFELSKESIISFYVDLQDKSYSISGSCEIEFLILKGNEIIDKKSMLEIVEKKSLLIENRIVSNDALVDGAKGQKDAFAYGHYYSNGTTLIFSMEVNENFQGVISSASADLRACKRAKGKNRRITSNTRINAREISVGGSVARNYVFYGSMLGMPEIYDHCDVKFKLKDNHGVVIQEVSAQIKKAGKFISDLDEREQEPWHDLKL